MTIIRSRILEGKRRKKHKSTPEEKEKIVDLLKQGAGILSIEKLIGVPRTVIRTIKKGGIYPTSKSSSLYGHVTVFSEDRLMGAILDKMSPREAAAYAGIMESVARGFWRKIGYDYLTQEEFDQLKELKAEGTSIDGIAKETLLTDAEVRYFLPRVSKD